MPQFERLTQNRHSSFGGGLNSPRVRQKGRGSDAHAFYAQAKTKRRRTSRRKKKSGGAGAFLRNLIILGLIVGLVIFLKNGGTKQVQGFFQGTVSKIEFELPTPNMNIIEENNAQETKADEAKEALMRFFADVREGEPRSLQIVEKTREGVVRKRAEIRESAERVMQTASATEPSTQKAKAEPVRSSAPATAPAKKVETRKPVAQKKPAPAPATKTASRTTSTPAKKQRVANTLPKRTATPDAPKQTKKVIPASKPKPEPKRTVPTVSDKPYYVYFAQYDESSGTMTLVPQKRDLGYKPRMQDAIKALLQGPTSAEQSRNIMTCVPERAYLLDAVQDGSTVYLNFNSHFENNAYGPSGLKVQIYQIVYTVTQFPGVERVVFRINGRSKEVIGGDGAVLNRPFERFNGKTVLSVD